MKILSKYIKIILLVLFFYSIPVGYAAASQPYDKIFTAALQPGVELHPGMTKTEFKLCQIRRIFCGKTAVAIVAFAIVLVGMMIFNNKLTWPALLIIVIGIIAFINADKLAKTFGKNTFTVVFFPNPLCNCDCNLNNIKDYATKWLKIDDPKDVIALQNAAPCK